MLHRGRKYPKHSVNDRHEFVLQLAPRGLQTRARTSLLTTYLHPLTLQPSTPGSTTGRYKVIAFIAIAALPKHEFSNGHLLSAQPGSSESVLYRHGMECRMWMRHSKGPGLGHMLKMHGQHSASRYLDSCSALLLGLFFTPKTVAVQKI